MKRLLFPSPNVPIRSSRLSILRSLNVPESEFLITAINAARSAGDVLLDWSKKFTVSEKSRKNLVTEADVAAQETIFRIIHDRFPDHGFLGEEGLAVAGASDEFRWIIDPLDGTANYVHQFPYYCVSIALERNGDLITGVVFDPTRSDVFSAELGNGAFLNGKRLRTSPCSVLNEAMCVASLPVGAKGDEPQVVQFINALPRCRSVQRTGSAALNLCYIAAGRLDAYWSGTLKPWDMAAGALLVTEAGGQVTKMDNSPFVVGHSDLLATCGGIHGNLARVLSDTDAWQLSITRNPGIRPAN